VADALLTERTLSAEKIDELTGRSVNDLRGVDMAGLRINSGLRSR
jgi:hypothetical protein